MRKLQEGYLLLVTIFLLFIMGALSTIMVGMSSGNSEATVNSALGTQAYYVSESGINMAIRYWYSKGVDCSSITGNADLTNRVIGNGMFTVTASSTLASSTLSSAITASSATIPLQTTTGFAAQGVVTIGSEGIYYTGVSGNNLTGAYRGMGGTTAASQSSGAAVTQNQCVMTSTGAVNNLTSPLARRVLQATLFTFPAAAADSYPPLIARGRVDMTNGSVTNGHSCLTCSNYAGSTIQTNSTSNNTFSGFGTLVDANAQDGGNLTTSSSNNNLKPDVTLGTTYTTTSLYNTYFSKSTSYIQANASYVGRNVLNRTGVIYADGNVNISNGNLGTSTNPVLMYVDGNFRATGVGIYGVIYVKGNVNLTNLSFYGAIATESRYSQSGVGLIYDYAMLSAMAANPTYSNFMNTLGISAGSGAGAKNPAPGNTEEIFG